MAEARRPDHAAHDRTLVAALAAGDLEAAALAEASELVGSCPDCAELHADLVAIATAVRELPAPVRTRDFRLDPTQAAALRPSGWRRLVAAIGSPRATLVRPLAITFTTLGLVGLLLASVPAGPLGMLGSAGGGETSADREYLTGVQESVDAAASPVEPAAPGALPSDATVRASSSANAAPDGALPADASKAPVDPAGPSAGPSGGPSPVALVSIALLGAGIGLLALSVVDRRARTR